MDISYYQASVRGVFLTARPAAISLAVINALTGITYHLKHHAPPVLPTASSAQTTPSALSVPQGSSPHLQVAPCMIAQPSVLSARPALIMPALPASKGPISQEAVV